MIQVVAQSARGGGVVRFPWIGAEFQEVTATIAEGLGIDKHDRHVAARPRQERGPADHVDGKGVQEKGRSRHLSNALPEAVEEVDQRLQAARVSGNAPIPAALDVTVSVDRCAEEAA